MQRAICVLSRPLDFAAVTDHSELIAATSICTDPGSRGYDSSTCRSYREGNASNADFGDFIVSIGFFPGKHVRLCRTDRALCEEELFNVWSETIDAAEEFYDRTDSCEFTTFIGYEWTGTAGVGGRNIHRNVLFRNTTVIERPISYLDATTPDQLWNALEAICLEGDANCDVLAIPHNSNIAVGEMFVPLTEGEEMYDQSFAERRARLEPLMEIYQHKGASECVSRVDDPLASEDEFCDFEQFFENHCTGPNEPDENCTKPCRGGELSFLGGCIAAGDFARGALRSGLSEYLRVGANPFRLGFIASTDTHAGLSGGVEESNWQGHTGNADDQPEERLEPPENILLSVRTSSPGGLAVIWAEENTRDSLFDAMRRRETYGTSGTRIITRFFGGWNYAENSCEQTNLVEQGYEGGVPMGSLLSERTSDTPHFIVSAMRDAQSAPLQRIQIIKGWADPSSGETHERVYEVAGEPENGASVDLETCTPELPPGGTEQSQLCARWSDPDFDPAMPAFYYARVLENPTCRWSQHLCNAQNVDCEAQEPDDPLASCCDNSIPPTIQERAWTSPIWYLP